MSGGERWHSGVKLFELPRKDCLICFAGATKFLGGTFPFFCEPAVLDASPGNAAVSAALCGRDARVPGKAKAYEVLGTTFTKMGMLPSQITVDVYGDDTQFIDKQQEETGEEQEQ